ncbi:MAG: hypothetical protein A2X28_10775 [Elusimicrobia bacterium GWA2_56_46]|nr:MAG: hypothetical protein A2X28_10775 [Elusimicrobia bacterium GWA2_56_46]OGR55748.1 MAG: hypothetical protein A2X39_10395 [Elusimicrobia bacterium GWC2_56_31]HBB66110.1 hypothetical protein [Elusimicrobiota bacterium]
MGSEFVDKHRRKSLLTLLLLIVRGRARYVTIALLVAAASLPFVISGETLSRLFEMPPVAAALRMAGLGGLAASFNPKYSGEFVKAAIDRAALESARTSYWNRLMSAVSSALPCRGEGCSNVSSIAMVTGGAELSMPVSRKAGGKRAGSGQVMGVVNAEERARGEDGGAVDLAGIPVSPESGLYGDTMGQNLADRYSSGGSAPYADRSALSGPGAGSRQEGIYSTAMNQSGARVPIPGGPRRVNARRMGRVSGFSWKNVGYRTRSAAVDKQVGSRRPLFQLAETYSATGSASRSQDSAYEYQAAYTGSTYDGNDVNLDVIQTDDNPPVVPEGGFTDSLNDVTGLQRQAENCANAQSVQGARMSEDAAEMDRISQRSSPPPCYGDIGPWNAGVARQGELCRDFNANQTELANACQTSNTPMDCGIYFRDTRSGGMVISRCRRPSGRFNIFMMLLMIVLAVFAVVAMILGPLIAFVAAAIVGYLMYNYIMSRIAAAMAAALAQAEALYRSVTTANKDARSGFKKDE